MKHFAERKEWFSGLVLLLWLTLLTAFSSYAFAESPTKPVRLGIMSSFSGTASVLTLRSLDGCKLCVEKTYNGKILGRPIELIVRDDALSPQKAVENFRELNLVHNVDFTLGMISSGAACAVSPIAKKLQKPILYWDSKSPKQIVELGGRYVFRTVSDTYMDVSAVTQVCSKKPWAKYVTISPDYEYGHSVVDLFKQQLGKLKPDAQIIGEHWPKLGEVDFTSYIPGIIKAKPDCLYVGLWGGDGMTFIRQAKPYGLFEKMAVIILNEEDTIYAMGMDFPEGIFMEANYHFNFEDIRANQEYVKAYMEKYGTLPTSHSMYGYVATQFVLEAIKKAKTTDKEKVIDILRGLTLDTVVGPMTIRKYDQQANMPVYVGQTYKSPEYPKHLILKKVGFKRGEEIMMPIEEVKKMRGE